MDEPQTLLTYYQRRDAVMVPCRPQAIDVDDPIVTETGPKEGEPHMMCEAFPTDIPKGIWQDRIDHRQPHKGDHGIQWAPLRPDWRHPKERGRAGP